MEDIDELKAIAKKNAFWYSLGYYSLGLISAWALFSNSFEDNDFVYTVVGLIAIITLPVFILNFPVLYAGETNILIIVVIELIIFSIFWLGCYRFLLGRYKRQERLPPGE